MSTNALIYNPSPSQIAMQNALNPIKQQVTNNVGSDPNTKLPTKVLGYSTQDTKDNLGYVFGSLETAKGDTPEELRSSLKSSLDKVVGTADSGAISDSITSAVQKSDYAALGKALDEVLTKVGDSNHAADAQSYASTLGTHLGQDPLKASTTTASQGVTSSGGVATNPLAQPKTYDWNAMAEAVKKIT